MTCQMKIIPNRILTGKFENCAPEIQKFTSKYIYIEHQNCVPDISVAQYKFFRLEQHLEGHII